MTWFGDLEPCTYFSAPEVMRAVGWLEQGREYATGSTPRAVYDRLRELFVEPFAPVALGGAHMCDLCQFDGPGGAANIWIPGDGFLYVCPKLILHYIGTHSYMPPAEFQQAVLRCPDTRSIEYKKAFLANGGREFLARLREAVERSRGAGQQGDGD
jgi:hypothetical protein